MKKSHNKRIVLNKKAVAIISIVLLLLSIFLIQERYNTSFIGKTIKDIFLTPINIIVTNFKKNEIDKNIDNNYVKELQLKNEEQKKEIEELKELVNINDMLGDSIVVTANVIERNMSFFFDTITINRGSSSGIEEGMAVINGQGLIGRTTNVGAYYSDVILLTSKNIGPVSVKIKSDDNFIYGLLNFYDSNKNIYYVEGISETIDIKIASDVTTTGMGSTFPSGILIGKVVNITTDHFDLTKRLEIKPSININDYTVVSVLKRNVNNL